MTFREILEAECRRSRENIDWTQLYDGVGTDLLQNTGEGITALAVEMDERVNGMWVSAEED